MSSTWSDQQIIHFVKNVLGCGCPDEVFKKIEISEITNSRYPFQVSRINIGDTLLIYLVRPGSVSVLIDNVKHLASTGREDRDTHAFNRFRLVIGGDEKALSSHEVDQAFSIEAGDDEKMHMHVIDAEAIEGL